MRPHIICHMGTSIDGRLHPSRFTVAAKGISPEVLRGHYEHVHDQFEADGWIVGRVTMCEMAKGTERTIENPPEVARKAHVGARNGRKLAIGIDPSGRVHFGKDNVGGDHAVAASFTPSSVVIWSRMINFWIFPVTVIGNSSTNRMCRGTL